MSTKKNIPKLFFISSMLIFSTVGVIRHYIPLPSGIISAFRGILGALTLALALLLLRKKLPTHGIRKKLPILILTGAFIGFNWMLLFESYNFTSIATDTLCYYLAPSFVILFSPLLLGEKLTPTKLLTLALSLVGMVSVSGVFENGFSLMGKNIIGVLLATGAALFYASVILCNKKIEGVDSGTLTVIELFSAGLVIFPYALFAERFSLSDFTPTVLLLLLLLGVVHTGIAYALYFGSLPHLSTTTVAILGYIDPIVAILLSTLLLKEPFTLHTVIGATLILGASILSDIQKEPRE